MEKDSLAKDSSGIHKGRLTGVVVAASVLYPTTLAGLYIMWYSGYPQTSFHFFNDNKEWMQMDKVGHMTTAYYLARVSHGLFRWTGLPKNKSIWISGGMAFGYESIIEILDGFSAGWGASSGDLIANFSGTAFFMSQQFAWDEQRFMLKYSFHPSKYAKYRPDLLGHSLIEQMNKDYNGISFWLSGNIHSFLPEDSKFPRWLNIAVGYGAGGMTGAFTNTSTYKGNPIPSFERYRKFMLSVDIDLTKIRTKSNLLKILFNAFGFIKIPAPAIEYNTLGEFKFHPFYF